MTRPSEALLGTTALVVVARLSCADALCIVANVTIHTGELGLAGFTGWQVDGGTTHDASSWVGGGQEDYSVNTTSVCLLPGTHTFTALYDGNSGWGPGWDSQGSRSDMYWTVARGCSVFGGGPSAGLVPRGSPQGHKDTNFAAALSQCGAGSFGSAGGSDCSLCPPGTHTDDFTGATSCCACPNTTAAVGFGFANCSTQCTTLDTSSFTALLHAVEFYFMLALFVITTAVWKLALPRGTAESIAIYSVFPLLAGLAVWMPAVARLRDVNGFVVALCVTLALRTVTFTLKTKTLRCGGSNARSASYWRCLAAAWLSLTCFWTVVGSGDKWRAPFFWQPSAPFCGTFTDPMSSTRTAVCVLYSLAMAVHAWGWSCIARQSTPYQALLPGVLDKKINERAVYSFSAKSAYLWIGGGQGLIGTASSYVSSVVPLLVYSEVLHAFKGTLLLYATFVEQSGLKKKAVGLKERWGARGCVIALAVLALVLFSVKEVFDTGARTADTNSLLTIFVLMVLELGGDAELARRMHRSRAAGAPSYLAVAAAGTADVPPAPQQEKQKLELPVTPAPLRGKRCVLAALATLAMPALLGYWVTQGQGHSASRTEVGALATSIVLSLVFLIGLAGARFRAGWRCFMPGNAAHTTQFVVGMVVPLLGGGLMTIGSYAGGASDDANETASMFAFALVLPIFKAHVFSLKIHSLRGVTWDNPHAVFLHRVWWRTCCACWLGAAIVAAVGWNAPSNAYSPGYTAPIQSVHSKCAIAFCAAMALDALFWGRAAERCKALAAKTEFTKEFTSTQIALFNAKQVYVWVLQLSVLFAVRAITVQAVLQVAYLVAFAMVLHCFKSRIFTSSVFDASGSMAGPNGLSVRALTRLSTGVGLTLFACVTFLSQGGISMDDFTATLSTVSAFALLAPELLADYLLLFLWDGGGTGDALDADLLNHAGGAKLLDRASGADVDGHTADQEVITGGAFVPVRTQRKAVAMYGAAVVVLAIISMVHFSAVFADVPMGGGGGGGG
jgi:hypothetical protein